MFHRIRAQADGPHAALSGFILPARANPDSGRRRRAGLLVAALALCSMIASLVSPAAARADEPVLSVDQQSIALSDTVEVRFDAGDRVNAKNWIGIYHDGVRPGAGRTSVDWRYVPERSGSVTWGPSARDGWTQEVGSVDAGDYDIYLLERDGYTVLAGPIDLTVTEDPFVPTEPKPKVDGVSELNVLTFNIWNGGTMVPDGAQQVAGVISQTDADVTFLPEPGRMAAQVGGLLGYHYFETSTNTAIVSRYPIIGTDVIGGRWTKAVLDVNGTEVAVYGGHLEYRWYATYLPRGYGGMVLGDWPTGWNTWNKLEAPVTDVEAILAANLQSGRPASAATALTDIANERAAGRLVILGGDFNEPSTQDWTRETAHLQDHNGVVVQWQTTQTLLDGGMVDAFREVYPDPVANPGTTWPSDNPRFAPSELSWAPEADERDRIDYVFADVDERLEIEDAAVVGPKSTIIRSEAIQDDSEDVIITPDVVWPSDHKAVLVNFRVCENGCAVPEPIAPSVTLGADTVEAGSTVSVTGSGFLPETQVFIELHSDPVRLGSAYTNAQGDFQAEVSIPAETEPGDHAIVVIGVGVDEMSIPLTVTSSTGSGEEPGGEDPGGSPGTDDPDGPDSEEPGTDGAGPGSGGADPNGADSEGSDGMTGGLARSGTDEASLAAMAILAAVMLAAGLILVRRQSSSV